MFKKCFCCSQLLYRRLPSFKMQLLSIFNMSEWLLLLTMVST